MIRMFAVLFSLVTLACFADDITVDVLPVNGGTVKLHLIKHATFFIEHGPAIIHVDPVLQYADYRTLPKADIILITHDHPDHCDGNAVTLIGKKDTVIIGNARAVEKLKQGQAISNGQTVTVKGILIRAVPAYNTTAGRAIFHPKGRDNGYVLTLGGKQFYIAGDTEDIPEMKSLTGIYAAFLPMNQPYTMTPEQIVSVIRTVRPAVTYPYHTGNTDMSKFRELVRDEKYTDVRIREMQ